MSQRFNQLLQGANISCKHHELDSCFFWTDIYFYRCIDGSYISLHTATPILAQLIAIPKFLFELCSFLLAPLAVWIFLAYKYWKTRITIDAVEKFLKDATNDWPNEVRLQKGLTNAWPIEQVRREQLWDGAAGDDWWKKEHRPKHGDLEPGVLPVMGV